MKPAKPINIQHNERVLQSLQATFGAMIDLRACSYTKEKARARWLCRRPAPEQKRGAVEGTTAPGKSYEKRQAHRRILTRAGAAPRVTGGDRQSGSGQARGGGDQARRLRTWGCDSAAALHLNQPFEAAAPRVPGAPPAESWPDMRAPSIWSPDSPMRL